MISKATNDFWHASFGHDYMPSEMDAGLALQMTIAKHFPEELDDWTLNRLKEIEREMFDREQRKIAPEFRTAFIPTF